MDIIECIQKVTPTQFLPIEDLIVPQKYGQQESEMVELNLFLSKDATEEYATWVKQASDDEWLVYTMKGVEERRETIDDI